MFRTRKPRSARRPAARPRLGIHALDDRLLPSVTAAVQPGGVLNIAGDAANDEVYVYRRQDNSIAVERTTVGSQNYTLQAFHGVNRIAFDGGPGDDRFYNLTDLPSRSTGGLGNDFLDGGSGTDEFIGSPGNDQYIGRGGIDVHHRNGYRGGHAVDLSIGLVNGRLTDAELSAGGALTVSRSADANTLTFSGPTGAGFIVQGTFSRSLVNTVGGLRERFTALGAASLVTALGTLPLNGLGGFQVTAVPSGAAGIGLYESANFAGLTVDTNNPFSPLNHLKTQYGVGLTLPGVQFGLALGGQLEHLDAPLNAAVPYFYLNVESALTVSVGNVDVSVSALVPASSVVAFDPSDPSLYVRVTPRAGPVGEVAVGGSRQGYIPFTPLQAPDAATTPLHGNLYFFGQISIGDYPVSVLGEAVLDLNANDDAQGVGINPARLAAVLTGGGGDLRTLLGNAGGALTDIRLGVNGETTLTPSQYSGLIELPLTQGTLVYTPQQIAFRGGSVNPFEGTPLGSVLSPATFDVQGHYNLNDNSWGFRATAATARIGGFQGAGLTLEASSATSSVSASFRVAGLLGLVEVGVSGWADYTTGNFSLTGYAAFDLDGGPIDLHASATVTFARTWGDVRIGVNLNAWFSASVGGLGVGGSVNANFTIRAGANGLSYSGSGTATGTVYVPVVSDPSISASFALDHHGFRIDLPLVPDIVVAW